MTNNSSGEVNTTIIKARNPFIAFCLSFFFPGLGHIYNGQPIKTLLTLFLYLIVPHLYNILSHEISYKGLLTLFLTLLVILAYSCFDSVKNARKQQNYKLKTYNHWYFYLPCALLISTFIFLYHYNPIIGINILKIPSISNNPTIQIGDKVIADTKVYKNENPNYGDIVLFTNSNNQFYCYRVVGKPNDKVKIVENTLIINTIPCKRIYIKDTVNVGYPTIQNEEVLPNGYRHQIYLLKYPFDNSLSNFEETTVPADSYFLLGDNRNISFDSRKIGFISKDRIKGRIMFNVWGKTIK